jgi:hypothetical protein
VTGCFRLRRYSFTPFLRADGALRNSVRFDKRDSGGAANSHLRFEAPKIKKVRLHYMKDGNDMIVDKVIYAAKD